MRNVRYRRRRRTLNPVRALSVLLVVVLIAVLVTWLIKPALFGKKSPTLPTESGETVASSTGTGSGTDTESTIPTASDKTPGPPTPKPTAEPMRIASENPDEIRMSWKTPSVFDGENAWADTATSTKMPDGSELKSWVIQNNQPLTDYVAPENISFGNSADYAKIDGVLTFRGNAYRDSAAFGKANVVDKKLDIVWTQATGAISSTGSFWPGTGWTGQPLLVHWPEETRQAMNITDSFKSQDLVEVIYPTLDGNIYFLDLVTGAPTREKITMGYPFKGTAVVDPRGYPLLFAGQGLNENDSKVTEFKYRFYNLIDQSEIYGLFGRDEAAFRPWGAFDSSGLVDATTDTLIQGGENGLLYKVKLNSDFDAAAKTMTLAPQVTKYRFHSSHTDELGIEGSPAAYRNYLYFNDNGGLLQCVDMNTLKPVWVYNTQDDSDCTTTIELDDKGVWLYTANEVDKRVADGSKPGDNSNIRKFNALTGELIWQVDVPCIYQYYINGGALATPLVGKNDIADLIIFNIALTDNNQSGTLLAIDKATGAKVWERKLNAYSWSSPVGILSEDGTTYGIFCDFAGIMHLFDPKTGKDLDTISLGRNVESSPAVYNDMIVVGSYDKKIFGIRIH